MSVSPPWWARWASPIWPLGHAHSSCGFPESFDVAWKPPAIDVIHAVHCSPVYIFYRIKSKSAWQHGYRQRARAISGFFQFPCLGALSYPFHAGSLDAQIRRRPPRGRPGTAQHCPALRCAASTWCRGTIGVVGSVIMWAPPFSVWCTGVVNGPCTEPALAGQAEYGARKQIRSGVCNDGATRLAGL